MAVTAKDILDLIKEKDVKYVDVRFTDIRGKMQHVTFDIDLVDEEFLTDGTMFDGSSIAGWKAINESDMKLRPDLETAIIDPFYQQTTLCLMCDIVNPDTGTPYNRDPRSIAKAALNYVKASGIGDTVFFGPEAEFFIFDDVRWSTQPHDTGYAFDSTELPANTGSEYSEGNMGTALDRRAAISRSIRSTAARTCAARCWRSCATWACSPKSTTTRWRRPSTNWA